MCNYTFLLYTFLIELILLYYGANSSVICIWLAVLIVTHVTFPAFYEMSKEFTIQNRAYYSEIILKKFFFKNLYPLIQIRIHFENTLDSLIQF